MHSKKMGLCARKRLQRQRVRRARKLAWPASHLLVHHVLPLTLCTTSCATCSRATSRLRSLKIAYSQEAIRDHLECEAFAQLDRELNVYVLDADAGGASTPFPSAVITTACTSPRTRASRRVRAAHSQPPFSHLCLYPTASLKTSWKDTHPLRTWLCTLLHKHTHIHAHALVLTPIVPLCVTAQTRREAQQDSHESGGHAEPAVEGRHLERLDILASVTHTHTRTHARMHSISNPTAHPQWRSLAVCSHGKTAGERAAWRATVAPYTPTGHPHWPPTSLTNLPLPHSPPPRSPLPLPSTPPPSP
jgi:hypothetical protein